MDGISHTAQMNWISRIKNDIIWKSSNSKMFIEQCFAIKIAEQSEFSMIDS